VISDAINIIENVPSTTDSCGNTVNTGSTCQSNANLLPGNTTQFTDVLNDCPNITHISCSFQFTNQQWQQCNKDGSFSSIGTVGTVTVTSSGSTVNGNTTSLVGTTFH
jgi:hypothetical protein